MVNAHSHAFQRDLRGAAERPAPEAHAADDFWSWREAMYALAGAPRPRDDARGRRRACTRRWRPRATAPSASSTTSTTARTARPTTSRTRWRSPSPRPRVGGGPAHRAPPRRLPPRRVRRSRRRPASAASATPTWGRSSRASTRCAPGRTAARACTSASPPTACARCPATWLEAIAAYAEQHGLVRHVHAHEQPRELEECRAEHGVSPIELLAPHRLPRPAHERDPRHPRRRPRPAPARRHGHDRRLVPDDRGQPRRRPLPRAAPPRRRRADRDRLGLQRARRPVRGGARARDARPARAAHAPRAARRATATSGASWPRPGARASASTTPGRSRSTATTRTCAASPTPTSRSRSRPARRPPSWRDPRAARVPRRATTHGSRSSSCTRTPSRPARRAPGTRATTCAPSRARRSRPTRTGWSPTGIAIALPPGVAGLVTPRSGLAAQHGITLVNTPGLIDPNYRGEIKVILRNEGGEAVRRRARRPRSPSCCSSPSGHPRSRSSAR